MLDAERLTDERVREIVESGEVYIEPLAESDFGRGVGHENWPSKEAAALAREVLAHRKGLTPPAKGPTQGPNLAAEGPDSPLTDEEREALERVAFDSGLGEHRFPEQTAERLADLVRRALAAVPRLAARAGDREEREALAAAVGRASMQPGIGHYCADGFEGALKRYREAVLAYRAAPGGETRKEETDA